MDKDKVLLWSTKWNMYWRPNSSGYTNFIDEAGLYDPDDAKNISKGTHYTNVIKPLTPELLQTRLEELNIKKHGLQYELEVTDKKILSLINMMSDFWKLKKENKDKEKVNET